MRTTHEEGTREMERVLARQREAFLAELPVPRRVRDDRLARAIELLKTHQDDLAAAMDEDFGGRPHLMSKLTDIVSAVKALSHARRHLKFWMRPEKRSVDFPLGLFGARAWVEFEPKGVVGLISPWNFPVNLTFGPLAGIFAAGNRVMIKPSEFTPRTSALMKELIARWFDETEAFVVTGDAEIGAAFAGQPFDHLLFTGATGVARHVMRAAAEHLVPVTLELGGKSPVIVSRSADLERTAGRVVAGKMMNAGQICLAPDYMLVPRERRDEIIEGLAEAASSFYPQIKNNPDYTAIINERHKQRLEGYVEDARRRGAQIRIVNPGDENFSADDNSRMMPLHILWDVTDEMQVMREEIFGPLLPVLAYEDIDEAIAYVNRRPRPLGLYYFGEDEKECRRVLDRTISGGVTLDDVVWHVSDEDLPFGGVGPSGIGSYHGRDGFRTFSHARAVFRQPKIDVLKLAGAIPPYGRKLERTLKMQMKG
ncbi:MAG: coniferyl aldehyde dehydrogenase [Alphaproteobacteria bacterium]|nr:MAG: coniferyl aldehyde dehydrogenase [Alphaproteobacteria bacterium]